MYYIPEESREKAVHPRQNGSLFPIISLVLETKRKAFGSCSLIKFRSFTACEGLRTVRIIYLSSPVKAPVAFTMVAPRCRSFWIKSQIHVALEVTT